MSDEVLKCRSAVKAVASGRGGVLDYGRGIIQKVITTGRGVWYQVKLDADGSVMKFRRSSLKVVA